MKSSKRNMFFSLVFSSILFFSGCGVDSEKINAPVDIRYIVENPLYFSEVSENDQLGEMAYTGSYFQISGLKNQQVEDKINQQLKGIYGKYRPGELPQEGTEKYDGWLCIRQDIRLHCYGNFNNILSLAAEYSWEYEDAEATLSWQNRQTDDLQDGNEAAELGRQNVMRAPMPYGEREYRTETYNFDLNTGETFGLKEVFADHVDYGGMIKLQAEAMLKEEEIEHPKGTLEQVVNTYLANPQFVLDGSSVSTRGLRYPDPTSLNGEERELYLPLHFDENFAITKRFYDPKQSIYLGNQEGAKTLLTNVGEEEAWEKKYTEAGIRIHLRGFQQKKFPVAIKLMLKAEETADGQLIEEMKQGLKHTATSEVSANYDKWVTTSQVQDFINVRIYEDGYITSEKDDDLLLSYAQQTLRCYKKGSDKPTNIREIFAAGADVEGILASVVSDKLEANQRLLEEGGMKRTIDVAIHANDAINKIVGFCVNHESIVVEYLGDPDLPSYVMELTYADIGYDHLNLFD